MPPRQIDDVGRSDFSDDSGDAGLLSVREHGNALVISPCEDRACESRRVQEEPSSISDRGNFDLATMATKRRRRSGRAVRPTNRDAALARESDLLVTED
jgi:hypothetical protein